MSQKFHRTKEFLKLNKQWQKKLAKSGFEDIEQDEQNLKDWSAKFSLQKSLDGYKFKQAYYYMATHFLNDNTFDTNLDKIIWEYHSEGISLRNIIKLLTKVKIHMNKEAVWKKIKLMRSKMYEMYNKDE